MAYAALVSLSQILEQMMQHGHYFYIPLHDDEELILIALQEKVGVLLGFLDDHHSHIGGGINQILHQSLEARIRDAAYKAQDVVEYHISDQKNTHMLGRNSCGLWQLFPSFGQERAQTHRNEYESELVMALELIDSVVDEAMNIGTSSRGEKARISRAPSLPSSSNSTTNYGNRMVGFDEDMLKVKEVLCGGSSSPLKVVSIVGMGGIGKTTLARNIYADSYISDYFDTCAWATISPGYSLRGIRLSLLHTLTLQTEEIEDYIKTSYLDGTGDEELEEYVYKSLKGRTYLVVLDDMWSTEAWDDVRRIFPNDNNGSRVVVTTRQRNVAEHASSSLIHHLHFLNPDQSWSLIKDKVFAGQTCPLGLEEIGKTIAINCGGLPLAIVVVAGILAKVERSIDQWQDIAGNSIAMAAGDEHFLKILSLSYDYLPNHLKPCFLYMASFLNATEIRISRLAMLWVAEGFLKPDGSKTLEEVAEEYLEDLVKRNLVLITKTRSNGKFKSCSVHDLLKDLCVQKAKGEKFLCVRPALGADIADQRRIALDSCNYLNATASSIRSVFFSGSDTEASPTLDFVLALKLLRVLHVPKVPLYVTPDLFHLRYLAFTYGGYDHLNLHKLQNLQTLIIHPSSHLTQVVPLKMWKTPKLKHLVLFNARLRLALPPRLVPPSSIQTLTGVVDFNLSRQALGMISNLKKLKASYTRMSKAKCRELRLDKLNLLQKLETLDLAFVSAPSTLMMRMRGRRPIPFPSIYTLPPNLKKLTLTGCSPPSENMSLIGSLHNLEVLKLREFYFAEQEWRPKEEQFPKLKFLMIELSNLVCWRVESGHFPCLEHLVIRKCRSLEKIPLTIGDIETLRLMEVGPYSKSAAESAVEIREEQEGNGNDDLQVRVYLEEWENLEQDSDQKTDGEESNERSSEGSEVE